MVFGKEEWVELPGPGLEGIETVTGKDIAALIIEHIEKSARPPKVYRPRHL